MDRYDRMLIRAAADWRKRLSRNRNQIIDPLTGEIIDQAEVHHIARAKYGEASIPLSVGSHREMTRRQMEEHPPDGPDPENPMERMARFQLGASDLLESIVDQMRADAEFMIAQTKGVRDETKD